MLSSRPYKLGTTLRNMGTATILLIIPFINFIAAIWLLVLYIQMIDHALNIGRDTGDQAITRFGHLMIVAFLLEIVEAIAVIVVAVQTVFLTLSMYFYPPFPVSQSALLAATIVGVVAAMVRGIIIIIAWQAMSDFFAVNAIDLPRKKGMDGAGYMKVAAIIVIVGSLVGFLVSSIELIFTIVGAVFLLLGYYTTGSAFQLHAGSGSGGASSAPGYRPWSSTGDGGVRSSTGAGPAGAPPSPAGGSYVPPANYRDEPVVGPASTGPARKQAFCTYCGAPLPGGDEQLRFCPSCGASVR